MSEPDFELKHRIVGAIILIGFAVVVLPWVLGGPGPVPQSQSAPGAATGQDATGDNTKVFVSRITPIGGATPPVLSVTKTAPETSVSTGISGQPEKEKVEPKPAPAEEKPAAAKPPPPASKPKPPAQTAKAAPALTRGWVVRIGTFSKPDNATRVMAELRDKGFRPSSSKVKTKIGLATRVWVGPYAKRVEAARVRTRIERVTGEKGLITPYP